MNSTTQNSPLPAKDISQYEHLLAEALRKIDSFDLSEASYHALFNDGLIPVEDMMRAAAKRLGRPFDSNVETEFAEAARAHISGRDYSSLPKNITLNGLLDH